MPFWTAIYRLLAVIAVAGLVAGAFAAPVRARPMADVPPSVSTSVSMDMDCCDPDTANPDCNDLKGCPFAALCAAKVMTGLPSIAVAPSRPWVSLGLTLSDERTPDGLAHLPSGHPPKRLS